MLNRFFENPTIIGRARKKTGATVMMAEWNHLRSPRLIWHASSHFTLRQESRKKPKYVVKPPKQASTMIILRHIHRLTSGSCRKKTGWRDILRHKMRIFLFHVVKIRAAVTGCQYRTSVRRCNEPRRNVRNAAADASGYCDAI